jgi:hypothetical protein
MTSRVASRRLLWSTEHLASEGSLLAALQYLSQILADGGT